jgi:hypothetical protein
MQRKGWAAAIGVAILAAAWSGGTADLDAADIAPVAAGGGIDLGLSRLYRNAGEPAPLIIWQRGPGIGSVQPVWDAPVGVTPAERAPAATLPAPRADRGGAVQVIVAN